MVFVLQFFYTMSLPKTVLGTRGFFDCPLPADISNRRPTVRLIYSRARPQEYRNIILPEVSLLAIVRDGNNSNKHHRRDAVYNTYKQ